MGETSRRKSLDSHTEIKSARVTRLWLENMEIKNDVVCRKLNEVLKLIPRIDRRDLHSAATVFSKFLSAGVDANSSVAEQMQEKIFIALNAALEIKNDLVLHPIVIKKSDQVSQTDLESQEKTSSKQKKKLLKYFNQLHSQKNQRKSIKETSSPTRIIINSQTNRSCSIQAILTPNKVSVVLKTKPENCFRSCHRIPETIANKQPQFTPKKSFVNNSSSTLASKTCELHGQRISTRRSMKEQKSSSVKDKLRNEKPIPVAAKKPGQKSLDSSQKPPWR